MRKFYALFLILFISSVVFSQSSGDYKWVATSANLWNSNNWEKYNGSSWVSTSDVPGISGGDISYTVYLEDNSNNDIYLLSDIVVTSSGKISVENGSSAFTLYVGYDGYGDGSISNYGQVGCEGNNAKIDINGSSSVINVRPGGSLYDASGGGRIVNETGVSGIVLHSTNGSITGSLNSAATLQGTFRQYIIDDQWHLVSPVFSDVESGDFWDGTNNAFIRPYTSPGGGWGDYINATDQVLSVGEGYELWETAAFTYTGTGTFITGNRTLSISTGGSGDEADFCLVGNPYPCGLDWGTVSSRTNCDGSAFYVYNGSSYLAHNGTTGAGSGDVGDASSGIIPAMQGFFVKSLGTGNISLSNSNKALADVNYYKSNKELPSYVSNFVRLSASYEDQEFTTVLYQQADATNGADDIYDAWVLFNNDPEFMDFYSFAGEKTSCINIYNELPYVVDLGLNVPAAGGDITISLVDIQNQDETFSALLEDRVTGQMIDLINEQESYTVNFSSGGSFNDRFVLHLNSTVGIEDAEEYQQINIYSHNKYLFINDIESQDKEIRIYDIVGKLVYSTRNSDEIFKKELNVISGYYLVEIIIDDTKISEKIYLN